MKNTTLDANYLFRKTTESTTVTKKGDQVEVSTVKTSKVISPEDDKPNKSNLPLVGASPMTKKNSKEVVVTNREVAEKTHVTMSKDEAKKEHVHSETKSYTTDVIDGPKSNNKERKEPSRGHSRNSSSSGSDSEKARVVYAKRINDDPALGVAVQKKERPRSKSYEILIENEFKDKQAWKQRYEKIYRNIQIW